MADLWSIISANYKTVGLTVPSKTPYVAVDPKLYEAALFIGDVYFKSADHANAGEWYGRAIAMKKMRASIPRLLSACCTSRTGTRVPPPMTT